MPQFIADFITAWNAHDVQKVASFYAPDYEEIDVAQTGSLRGRDNVGKRLAYYLRAFPDLRVTVDDIIVDNNRVALYWTWHGTHRGAFMRIPPTGRAVSVRGTSLMTMKDGLIQRAERIWDLAGLLRSIGLLPEL
jgi:steroid delta-isomerase-like uncharacterized protein